MQSQRLAYIPSQEVYVHSPVKCLTKWLNSCSMQICSSAELASMTCTIRSTNAHYSEKKAPHKASVTTIYMTFGKSYYTQKINFMQTLKCSAMIIENEQFNLPRFPSESIWKYLIHKQPEKTLMLCYFLIENLLRIDIFMLHFMLHIIILIIPQLKCWETAKTGTKRRFYQYQKAKFQNMPFKGDTTHT